MAIARLKASTVRVAPTTRHDQRSTWSRFLVLTINPCPLCSVPSNPHLGPDIGNDGFGWANVYLLPGILDIYLEVFIPARLPQKLPRVQRRRHSSSLLSSSSFTFTTANYIAIMVKPAGDGVPLFYTSAILIALTWVTFAARVGVRIWRKVLGLDDLLMLIGLVRLQPASPSRN